MLHRLAAFSAVPSSTRACGAVWHHRPPSDSLRGAVVRATVVPRRDARVFRPCSRAPILRAAWTPPERSQRSRTPCAHRLGERTKKQCLGRAMSPRRAARQPPSCHTDVAEPGPWCSCAGLALTRPRTPRAFHGFDDSIHGPNLFARHTNRGPAAAFRPSHVRAPFCEDDHHLTPFRVSGVLHRSTSRLVWPCGFPRTLRQDASNPLLQPTFHVTSTRDETSPLETARRALWETRQRSTSRRHPDAAFPLSRPRTAPDHLAVIRPPAAPCFDGTTPASARSAATLAQCAGGGKLCRFFGWRELRRREPLTPLVGGGIRGRRSGPFPVA